MFILDVYFVPDKRCTNSVFSWPASPRPWKNVTTAALEKVELQVVWSIQDVN